MNTLFFCPDSYAAIAGIGEGIAGFFMGIELREVRLLSEILQYGKGIASAQNEGLSECAELVV